MVRETEQENNDSCVSSACTHTLRLCVYVCASFTPQSLHCGAPVGGQHWETSVWLGWTGPSAGLTASRHTPAETHKWSQSFFNINIVIIKPHTSI